MRVLAIGPMPSTGAVTGLSVAFEMAVSGLESNSHQVFLVDTSPRNKGHVSGRFHIGRAMQLVVVLIRVGILMPRVSVVYLTISTSRLGLIKDAAIALLAKVFGKPLVGHLHGGGEASFFESSSAGGKKLIRACRAAFRTMIVLSEELRDEFYYLKGHLNVAVVANGLPEAVEPVEVARKSLSTNETANIVYLSNMMISKGCVALLDACAELRRQGVPFRCKFCGAFLDAVVGDGSVISEDWFVNRIDELGLADCVEYEGVVRGADKNDILSWAHVFVLPTWYPWEGQPISIIEALSWSTPVVSTNHKGIPGQVTSGVEGVLLDNVSPARIAAAIRSVVGDADNYSKMSAAARKAYEAKFTRHVFVQRLESVLAAAAI